MPFLFLLLVCFTTLSASSDPGSSSFMSSSSENSHSILHDCRIRQGDHELHQYFPCGRFVWSPVFPDNEMGLSFLGELGWSNYRLSATFGAIPSKHHRYKISTEYLLQKTSFRFHVGKKEPWLDQVGVGGTYQYISRPEGFYQGIQLNAVYVNCFNNHVKRAECRLTQQNHSRRIAGASFVRADIGAILSPWCESLLIVSGGYAQAEYSRRIHSRLKEQGPSLRVEFAQEINSNWALTFEAEFTRPFNALEGQFTYSRCCTDGHFTLAFFAGQTWGKRGLQDITSGGIELGWSFGIDGLRSCCHPKEPLKTIPSCCEMQDLMVWCANPAIYMPQALAISESCSGPKSDPIPEDSIPKNKRYHIDLGKHFAGKGLTFSATGLPPHTKFNTHTGVLTGRNDAMEARTFHIDVKAKNSCSTSTRPFTLHYSHGGGG